MKRRWLALGALVLALGITYAYVTYYGERAMQQEEAASVFSPSSSLQGTPSSLEEEASVTLRRLYVCGEREEALGVMPPERIADLAAAHPDWEFAAVSAGTVVFTEHIDDLSDDCKQNSYIGVDASGNLTLYEGPPSEQKAVKTFFQLDIEHLESALPNDVVEQLRSGIRIADIADYNSVLSTFSDYAIDETEKVMKPEL